MNFQKMMQEKREWRALQARAKALPADYYKVYKEMQKYLWKIGGADFESLVELFEENAAEGKDVLDVTGRDVAAFCDELAKSSPWANQLGDATAKAERQVADAIQKSLEK